MATSDCFVSAIAPLYNDARIIEYFVLEVLQVLRDNYSNYELVLVNDGSEDDTLERVSLLLKEHECIRLINLSRSFGTDVAISSGLDTVIGDFVVVMIPESDPPQLIPQLINQARNGKDILIGVRENRSHEPAWMRVSVNLFYWVCKWLFQIPLIQNATQFRVLSRQVVNAILQVQDRHRYLRLLSSYVGYSSQVFLYKPIRRSKTKKLKNLFELVDIAIQIIITNSLRPLRFATYLGLLASVLNIVYICYIFLVYLFKDRVAEGWVTLSFQSAIMFFFIFLVLTILCEYVGLIIDRSKGLPAYYITSEKNSSVLIPNQERKNIVKYSNDIQL